MTMAQSGADVPPPVAGDRPPFPAHLLKRAVLLLRVYGLLAFILIALRCVSPKRIMDLFSGKLFRPFFSASPQEAARLRYYVKFATSHRPFRLKRSACLIRSLILYLFLKPRAEGMELVMGLRRTDSGAVDGHAWLELEGRPVFDSRARVERFRKFWSYGL